MSRTHRSARHERGSEGARLRRAGIAPKRRFGQHFLFNPHLLDYLITQADIAQGACVLEVGPGSGALTRRLLQAGARITAVEIDRGLCGVLREQFAGNERFVLIEGDILAGKHHLNPAVVAHLRSWAESFRLVANLPFNAATPLLVLLLESDTGLRTAVVTVQDEVADRFVAAPGTAAYGIVSVLAQVLATAEKLLKIGRRSFSPPPRVDAAVLRVTPRVSGRPPTATYAILKELVAWAFSQRRKKLLPRVAARWPGAVHACPPDARPEEVPPEGYRLLAEAIGSASATPEKHHK